MTKDITKLKVSKSGSKIVPSSTLDGTSGHFLPPTSLKSAMEQRYKFFSTDIIVPKEAVNRFSVLQRIDKQSSGNSFRRKVVPFNPKTINQDLIFTAIQD